MVEQIVITIVDMVKKLRWQLLFAVLFGLVCSGVEVGYTHLSTDKEYSYTAKTELLFLEGKNSKQSFKENLEKQGLNILGVVSTYKDMIVSDGVLSGVAAEYYGNESASSIQKIRNKTTIANVEGSMVLTIKTSANSSKDASVLAQLLVKSFKDKVNDLTGMKNIQVNSKYKIYKYNTKKQSAILMIGLFFGGMALWVMIALAIIIYKENYEG